MLRIQRTHADDPDFVALIEKLNAFLAVLNGEEHAFYSQFSLRDSLPYVVVAHLNDEPVGCGAFRPNEMGAEIKRMFVNPSARGRGVGAAVLAELEKWASESGHTRAVLETSKRLEPAVALYQKAGYSVIQNYGPYVDVADSVCMEKDLPNR